jgi:hypothetical protein
LLSFDAEFVLSVCTDVNDIVAVGPMGLLSIRACPQECKYCEIGVGASLLTGIPATPMWKKAQVRTLNDLC